MPPVGGAPDDGVASKLASEGKLSFNGQHLVPGQNRQIAPTHSGASTPSPLSTHTSPRASFERPRSKDERTGAGPSPVLDENDPRETILKSFLPRVAVYASTDTEELVRLKGIYGGFGGLLRPFGEGIPGNVVIRDSGGASKSWNNFGIHFIEFGKGDENILGSRKPAPENGVKGSEGVDGAPHQQSQSSLIGSAVNWPAIDDVVNSSLAEGAVCSSHGSPSEDVDPRRGGRNITPTYYALYLRKLLMRSPMVPHETISHPVACVIAISSQCTSPIETLRELYSDTRQGIKKVPAWAGNEFLRYYVLVHDEDHDDIKKSTALFDQMKRHFGLHCHLLRLRSIECTDAEEYCMRMPECHWLSVEEELYNLRQAQDGMGDSRQYLFDTDAAVIRTFVREMVTQSILPFMEGRVTAWNDQVASRRRGISGRFMSLSKRWTGFGAARTTNSSPSNNSGALSSNYDSVQGFYAPNSPEAIMHRLGDYAFMLRDWKLASSIYDILRTDFGDDKAWKYHATVNEMTALSLLLTNHVASSSPKSETIDQVLDVASYSYITRCGNPQAAIRCLISAVELYRSRGGTAIRDAARWAERLLELSILTPLANGLFIERLAVCYTSQLGIGKSSWDSRYRKAAFSSLLAAEMWSNLQKPLNARERLSHAAELYSIHNEGSRTPPFPQMRDLWMQLQQDILVLTVTQDDLPKLDEEDKRGDRDDDEADKEYLGNLNTFDTSDVASSHIPSEGISVHERLNVPLHQADDGFV